ncbi:hypothetical protein EBQ26_11825 [Allofranklinella schreckenbergeri]|uniref:peptidylprolyl isomerase n=1 Tax=Allofranklinella schreckenbergeri TaxID=1076744 RepID=A0A3M6PWC4_9BURK|nr:peptidylprolyl isomerase [Allofranklinella schreckenbergeri]RMW95036.1 hypothetical protein EBQ26_11825 [Allofranklinella schreckenbergeri]
MQIQYFFSSLVIAFVLMASSGAQGQILLHREGQEITAQDFEADALALPANVRHHALSDPLKVEVVGKGLLVRNTLAALAREKGLDKGELAQIRLQQVQNAALMDFFLEDLFKSKTPSDSELLEYAKVEYKNNLDRFKLSSDERKASHILIAGLEGDSENKINDLYRQLEEGADFGELAFKFSNDSGSAPNYGSLGYVQEGEMVPELEVELKKLNEKGQYSNPFKSRFGWHIVRLDEVRPAGVLPFDAVRDELILEGKRKSFGDLRETTFQKIVSEIKMNREAIEGFAKKNKNMADQERDR